MVHKTSLSLRSRANSRTVAVDVTSRLSDRFIWYIFDCPSLSSPLQRRVQRNTSYPPDPTGTEDNFKIVAVRSQNLPEPYPVDAEGELHNPVSSVKAPSAKLLGARHDTSESRHASLGERDPVKYLASGGAP